MHVTIANVQVSIKSALTEAELTILINRAEAMMADVVGLPQESGYSVSNTFTTIGGVSKIFLPQRIYSVTSVTEDDELLVEDTDYVVRKNLGYIERLSGSKFGDEIVIVYKPEKMDSLWEDVVVNIVRLLVERTAMTSEKASEWSFNAPRWDAEIGAQLRRLQLGGTF